MSNVLENDSNCVECGSEFDWDTVEIGRKTCYRLPDGWYMDRFGYVLCPNCISNGQAEANECR